MEPTHSNNTTTNWEYVPMPALNLPELNWKSLLETIQSIYRDLPDDAEQRKCRAFLISFEKCKLTTVKKLLVQSIGKVDVQKNKNKSGVLVAVSAVPIRDFQPINELMSVEKFLKMCDETPKIEPTAAIIDAVYEDLSNGSVFFYKTDFDADGYQEFDVGRFDNPLKLLKVKLFGINTIYGQFGQARTIAYTHAEDHCAGSISKMYRGGIKIWIIIHAESVNLFHKRLRAALGLKTAKYCHLRSKLFHPTPSTLTSWGVRFSIIEQTINTIVITLPGTIHSILNLASNLNVSMNYSPTDLDLCSPIFMYKPCKCKWSQTSHYKWLLSQHLLPHPRNYRKHGQDLSEYFDQLPELIPLWISKASTYGKKKKYKCDFADCFWFSEFSANLKQHRHIHMEPEKRPQFECPHCSKGFMWRHNVRAHIKRKHPKVVAEK